MKVCRALGGFYLSDSSSVHEESRRTCVHLHHTLKFHSSAFAIWARYGAGLGMVTSPTRPTLGNHLWHLCFANIVQFECFHVFLFLVLLALPTTMPVAPSPVRSNDLFFACPEIHLGFCHVKLKVMHYFKLISANRGFVYL